MFPHTFPFYRYYNEFKILQREWEEVSEQDLDIAIQDLSNSFWYDRMQGVDPSYRKSIHSRQTSTLSLPPSRLLDTWNKRGSLDNVWKVIRLVLRLRCQTIVQGKMRGELINTTCNEFAWMKMQSLLNPWMCSIVDTESNVIQSPWSDADGQLAKLIVCYSLFIYPLSFMKKKM